MRAWPAPFEDVLILNGMKLSTAENAENAEILGVKYFRAFAIPEAAYCLPGIFEILISSACSAFSAVKKPLRFLTDARSPRE